MPRGRSLATRLVEDDQNSNMVLSNKISTQRRSSQIRLEKENIEARRREGKLVERVKY